MLGKAARKGRGMDERAIKFMNIVIFILPFVIDISSLFDRERSWRSGETRESNVRTSCVLCA